VQRRSFCRICSAACGIVVDVDGEHVLKVRGDQSHPVSHGYVCSKGRGLAEWHHASRRLDRPRVRGADVAWDDALDDLATSLQGIVDAGGPSAVGLYVATGTGFDSASTVATASWLRSLRSRSFYSAVTVDNAPAMVGTELVTGHPLLNPVWNPDVPGLLVLVGHNPVVSHGYGTAMPDPVTYLRRFRRGGGTLWVLDPRRTESAALADEHVAVRPGGDVSLLAALARGLLEDGADLDELHGHCDDASVSLLRDALEPFTIERASLAADVDTAQIERLLETIRAHPGQLNMFAGTGVMMGADGVLVEWLRWVLMILNGSLDKPDGMHFHDGWAPRITPVRHDGREHPGPASRPDLPRVARQMPVLALVDEIEAGNLRALVACGGNPLSACPEPERMRDALRRLETLVVIDVVDSELTEVATHVLPATGQLERADISSFPQVAMASTVQFTPAVVDAVAERRPVWWILGQLAARMGSDLLGRDPDAMTDEDYLRDLLATSPLDTEVVFANGPHGTPVPVEVGWVRESFLDDGCWNVAPQVLVDRLRAHHAPGPGLLLTPRREMGWSNSVSYGRAAHEEPVVRMHPDDLAEIGASGGARCAITSAHGTVEVEVTADDGIRRGVVSMTHGRAARPGTLISRLVDVDPLTAMPLASGVPVQVFPTRGGERPGQERGISLQGFFSH
jgi:anaerobic selenocysteine-containing dehydrogenase